MANSVFITMVISSAQQANFNQLLAMMFGDAPGSPELATGMSASGNDPATFYVAGMFDVDFPAGSGGIPAVQALSQGILPTPPNGSWPYMVGGVTILDQTDAAAAATALYYNVNSGPNMSALPAANLAAVLAALQLIIIEPPP